MFSCPKFASRTFKLMKHEIIERAESLFLKYGFKSITMDDMARELGISKKTLYQHFKNKDDLVENVVNSHMDKECAMVDKLIASAKNALDEIFLIARMYIEHLEQISPSAIYDLQKYYGKLYSEVMARQDQFDLELISKNIKRGQKEGFYRKDIKVEIVAKMFTKLTLVVVNEMANKNSKYSRRDLVKELHQYHMRSLTTTDGQLKWEKLYKQL